MPYTVEILRPEEWQVYRDVRLQSLKSDPTAFANSYENESVYTDDSWRAKLAQPGFSAYVVRDDGIIVGLVGCKKETNNRFEHSTILGPLYTDPKYRGMGIGTLLLQYLVEKLHTDPDVKKILLYVNESQKAACHLYEKVGFKKVGVLSKEAYINGVYYDQFLMELLFEEKF